MGAAAVGPTLGGTELGLGQAISYMLKHWEKLTLFLRQAGALQESEQGIRGPEAVRHNVGRGGVCERLLLELHVRKQINLRRL
jgi:hypothetical protein